MNPTPLGRNPTFKGDVLRLVTGTGLAQLGVLDNFWLQLSMSVKSRDVQFLSIIIL
jgi:hypothetical protein